MNCHVQLMVYAATCSGYTPAVLKHYALNTQEGRAQVGDDLGVDNEASKSILIASLYGAGDLPPVVGPVPLRE